jgi:roadblock/LC7 domain-containing protein
MRCVPGLAGVLIISLAPFAPAQTRPAQTNPAGVSVEEVPLCSTIGYDAVKSFSFSSDCQHAAFLGVKGDKQFIVRDGVESGPFEWVIPNSLTLSPHDARAACIVQQGNDMSVMIGGQIVGKGYYRIADDRIRFSDDGRHFAYTAQISDKGAVVVHDGVAGKMYPAASAPVFSPRGEHVAYAVSLPSGKMCAVLDDHEQKPYDGLDQTTLQFSPDGKHLAYTVVSEKKYVPVVDGSELSKPLEAMFLVFSPADDHIAYMGRTGNDCFVTLDGKPGPNFEAFDGPPVFSHDGRHLAYVAKRQKQAIVMLDGVGQEPFDEAAGESLTFSPDSAHLAYAAAKGKERFVVLDGKHLAPLDHIARPGIVFSPDGKRLAYSGVRGQQFVVVCDGVEGPRYERIVDMSFSSDSRHFVYRATANQQPLVVIDGKPSPPYDTLTPFTFSPGGSHCVYGGLRDAIATVVADGADLPKTYTAPMRDSKPVFLTTDAADLLMWRDRELLRVRVKFAGH